MNWLQLSLWSLPCFCLIVHAGDPYALDLTLGTDKKQVQLPVPTDGIIRLGVVKLAADAPSIVNLHLTTFSSATNSHSLAAHLEPATLTFLTNQVVAQALLHVSPPRPL